MDKAKQVTLTGFNAFILFADIKGYSSMREQELIRFYEKILPDISDLLKKHSPVSINTWGDAFFIIFRDSYNTAICALDLRDFFTRIQWSKIDVPRLSIRISLHSGQAYEGFDPILERDGYVGTQINIGARIEPIVKPGEVWSTDTFVKILDTVDQDEIECDDLGVRQLAKKWGGHHIFKIRRKTDPKTTDEEEIIDTTPIQKQDNVQTLISAYRATTDPELKIKVIDFLDNCPDSRTTEFLIEIARQGPSIAERSMAIKSLGSMADPVSVPTLLEILDDKETEPTIKLDAIEALALTKDIRAARAIISKLQNWENLTPPELRKSVAALAWLEHSNRDTILLKIIESDKIDTKTLVIAINTLKFVADEKAISKVLPFLDEQRYPDRVRSAALQFCIMVDARTAVDYFKKIAEDEAVGMNLREKALFGLTKADTQDAKATISQLAAKGTAISKIAIPLLIKGPDAIKDYEDNMLKELNIP